MRDFFGWIGKCLKIAPKGVREWLDVPATIVGIVGPFLAWLRPDFWNSDHGLLIMNALLWMVPCGFAWLWIGIRILVSPYLVYRELEGVSHGIRLELDQERDKNRPMLSAKIEQVAVDLDVGALMLLSSIRNQGANSIAENFQVFAMLEGGETELPGMYIVNNTTFPYGSGTMTIHSADSLAEKGSKAIPKGELVRGWLVCRVDKSLVESMNASLALRLQFNDIAGVVCATILPLNVCNDQTPRYMPGSGEFAPKMPNQNAPKSLTYEQKNTTSRQAKGRKKGR